MSAIFNPIVYQTLVWAGAILWHLGRIAMMRPAFRYLSDTRKMLVSFLVLYFVAALLSVATVQHVLQPQSLNVGLSVLTWLMGILFFAERSHRSSALTASLLGVSALVDLLMSLLTMADLFQTLVLHNVVSGTLGLVWSAVMVIQFSREPLEIRRRGYRFSQTNHFNSHHSH